MSSKMDPVLVTITGDPNFTCLIFFFFKKALILMIMFDQVIIE